jgi:hypothetical protein
MSAPPTANEADADVSTVAADTTSVDEEDLRQRLRRAMQHIQRSEPLEPTSKHLLLNGIVTPRRPVLVRDKFYKRLGSQLRPLVEKFVQDTQGKSIADRIAQRKPLDDTAMRAAFTLRDAKEHEQQGFLEATLASLPRRRGMDQQTWKRHMDAVAHGLQTTKKPAAAAFRTSAPAAAAATLSSSSTIITAAEQTELARQQADLDRQREQAKQREAARRQREQDERDEDQRRRQQQQRQRSAETPRHILHQLYQPIFQKLWDMEFGHLGGINPFRIVIDRENCASVGAPDYFDVIRKPMNLTYIKDKVDHMEYETLSAFFADVDLMIQNCLQYNSDPGNPYHVAALDLQKRYLKMAKKVVQTIQSKQQQQ